MAKINRNFSKLLLEMLIAILVMLGCFILLDLYIPAKMLLAGDNLNFSEILAFIKLKQYSPIVIAVSVGLASYRYWKSNKENN